MFLVASDWSHPPFLSTCPLWAPALPSAVSFSLPVSSLGRFHPSPIPPFFCLSLPPNASSLLLLTPLQFLHSSASHSLPVASLLQFYFLFLSFRCLSSSILFPATLVYCFVACLRLTWLKPKPNWHSLLAHKQTLKHSFDRFVMVSMTLCIRLVKSGLTFTQIMHAFFAAYIKCTMHSRTSMQF